MNHSALEGTDFFAKYLAYTGGTEVPTFFNRWACIVGLGAWAMQDVWFKFGSGNIHPNIYAMLVGEPGTRKSTAIKGMKKLLQRVGYEHFAGEKTSKEAYLTDLAATNHSGSGIGNLDARVDDILFGSIGSGEGPTTPSFIAADEFGDFFGNNVLEFISMLGVLWDFTGVYKSRVKTGNSVEIHNPNISIIGGNTTETLCKTFPPEALGQGFFSRLLFVYGEPNGRRIAFPRVKPEADTELMVGELLKVRESMKGEMVASTEARNAMEKIYEGYKGINDTRFASYGNRRFVHLIKLIMVHALADYSSTIELRHVVRANTVLSHTEQFMPKALGEFGRSRNSAVVHRIMQVLEASWKPLTMSEVWSHVHGDIDKIGELADAINGLIMSNKVMAVDGGFLPNRLVLTEATGPLYDWGYMTDEERKLE